jgi:hypothetical protein
MSSRNIDPFDVFKCPVNGTWGGHYHSRTKKKLEGCYFAWKPAFYSAISHQPPETLPLFGDQLAASGTSFVPSVQKPPIFI